jgi:hypothetical protein
MTSTDAMVNTSSPSAASVAANLATCESDGM